MTTADATPPTSSRTVISAIALFAVAGGTFALLQSLLAPALPTIERAFRVDSRTTAWVMTAYLLSATIMTPLVGRMGDIWGKRRIFIATLCAIVIGSMVSAAADDIVLMIVGRLIQGIGGAVFPLAFGILRDLLQGRTLHTAIGVVSGIGAAGGGVGAVLAGPVIDAFGYRWLFVGPAVVVAVAAIFAKALLPIPGVRSGGSINWLSTCFFSMWLVAALLLVGEGGSGTWPPAVLAAVTATAVLGFAAWVRAEHKATHPLIDLHLLRSRPVWSTSIVTFLLGIVLYGVQLLIPQFAQAPLDLGPAATVSESGFGLLPMLGAILITGLSGTAVIDRIGTRAALVGGAAIALCGSVQLVVLHEEIWQLATASFLIGLGIGLPLSAIPSLLVSTVPATQSAVVGGINANTRTIGGAVGAPLLTGIVAGPLAGMGGHDRYVLAFVVIAATILCVAAFSFTVPPGGPRRKAATHAELALVAGNTGLGTGDPYT